MVFKKEEGISEIPNDKRAWKLPGSFVICVMLISPINKIKL